MKRSRNTPRETLPKNDSKSLLHPRFEELNLPLTESIIQFSSFVCMGDGKNEIDNPKKPHDIIGDNGNIIGTHLWMEGGFPGCPFFIRDLFNIKHPELKKRLYTEPCLLGFYKTSDSLKPRIGILGFLDKEKKETLALVQELINPLYKYTLSVKAFPYKSEDYPTEEELKKSPHIVFAIEEGRGKKKQIIEVPIFFMVLDRILEKTKINQLTELKRELELSDTLSTTTTSQLVDLSYSSIPFLCNWLTFSPFIYALRGLRLKNNRKQSEKKTYDIRSEIIKQFRVFLTKIIVDGSNFVKWSKLGPDDFFSFYDFVAFGLSEKMLNNNKHEMMTILNAYYYNSKTNENLLILKYHLKTFLHYLVIHHQDLVKGKFDSHKIGEREEEHSMISTLEREEEKREEEIFDHHTPLPKNLKDAINKSGDASLIVDENFIKTLISAICNYQATLENTNEQNPPLNVEITSLDYILRDIGQPCSYFQLRNYIRIVDDAFLSHFGCDNNKDFKKIINPFNFSNSTTWRWVDYLRQLPGTIGTDKLYKRLDKYLKEKNNPYPPLLIISSSCPQTSTFYHKKLTAKNSNSNLIPTLDEELYMKYDWMMRIPNIYSHFETILSNDSIRLMLEYGHSFDSYKREQIKLEDISDNIRICTTIVGCIMVGIAINKFGQQQKHVSSGGLLFFNEVDTHEKFMRYSHFFDVFVQNSSYPLEVYKIICLLLHDCHCIIDEVLVSLKKEAQFFRKYIYDCSFTSLESSRFPFAQFIESLLVIQVHYLKNSSYSTKNYTDLISFPTLFQRIGLKKTRTENNNNTTTLEKDGVVDVEVKQQPNDLSKTINDNITSAYDLILEDKMNNVMEDLIIYDQTPGDFSKESEVNNNNDKHSNDTLSLIQKPKTLLDCFVFYGTKSNKKSKSDRTSKYVNINLGDVERIPDYMFMDIKTNCTVKEVTSFIKRVISSNFKLQKQTSSDKRKSTTNNENNDNDRDHASEISPLFKQAVQKYINAQYRVLFGSLDFTRGLLSTNGSPSSISLLQQEVDFFKKMLGYKKGTQKPDSSLKRTLVITTKFGGRFNSMETFQRLFGFCRSNPEQNNNKIKAMHLVNIEDLTKFCTETVPKNVFNFPYQNIIFDSVHVWTNEECYSLFKLLNQFPEKSFEKTQVFFLANSNTTKCYGYYIVRDLARFKKSLCENLLAEFSDNNNKSALEEINGNDKMKLKGEEYRKVSSMVSKNHIRRDFYLQSRTDELFDEEARRIQWDANCHLFEFIFPQEETGGSMLYDVQDADMPTNKTSYTKEHIDSFLAFLGNGFTGKRVVIIYCNPNSWIQTHKKESIKFEEDVKRITSLSSQVFSFYQWCIDKSSISTTKKNHATLEEANASLTSADSCFFLDLQNTPEKLLHSHFLLAIQKAIEMSKNSIYFDMDKNKVFTLFLKQAKDDTLRSDISTTFFNGDRVRDNTTSFLLEKLMEEVVTF